MSTGNEKPCPNAGLPCMVISMEREQWRAGAMRGRGSPVTLYAHSLPGRSTGNSHPRSLTSPYCTCLFPPAQSTPKRELRDRCPAACEMASKGLSPRQARGPTGRRAGRAEAGRWARGPAARAVCPGGQRPGLPAGVLETHRVLCLDGTLRSRQNALKMTPECLFPFAVMGRGSSYN